jgi:hypothetical protein
MRTGCGDSGPLVLMACAARRTFSRNRWMHQYDQLLAEIAGKIAKLQDQLGPAEQAHRLLLRSGDDCPVRDLRELQQLLDMAIQILERKSDMRSS